MDIEVEVGALAGGLDRCLAVVRNGHIVTITEGGRPFARIEPIDASIAAGTIAGRGACDAGDSAQGASPDPVEIAGTVSDLIDGHRR